MSKKKIKAEYRHKLFLIIWKEREDKNGYVNCFECNKKLHSDMYMMNSSVYSHILDKASYPEYELNENNIEVVCPDCHYSYTHNPTSTENQYNKYLKLKKEHDRR